MSMLQEGKNCWRRTRADRTAFVRAALRAQRSILIVGWDFNSRVRLWVDEAPPGVPPILGDFLDFLVRRRRGLQIHILDWDFLMIYAIDRETPPIFGLGWQPRRHIHLRFDRNFPTGGSQHQKIIVIDDAVAFSGGMDLAADRWDTPQHQADDPQPAAGRHAVSAGA